MLNPASSIKLKLGTNMGDLKEIFDVWVTRVRTPIFGYFSLSFLATNWKAIYFLLFSEVNTLSRIKYFETHTCITSLLWIPLGIAFVATLGYPWVQYGLMLATSSPNNKRKALNARAESDLLQLKIDLEDKRNELARQKEVEVVEKAKIDESIESIEDEATRKKAREEIESIRNRSSVLHQLISKDALEKYLQIRFPNLPANDRITRIFLNDLNSTKYKTIEDIDSVLESSKGFTEFYEKRNPSVFKSGIDYVTKSFGFLDPEFRKKHAFAKETLQAINEYSDRT